MSKRSPRSKLFRWRITRLKASPAALIGYVEAPGAEQAIRELREWLMQTARHWMATAIHEKKPPEPKPPHKLNSRVPRNTARIGRFSERGRSGARQWPLMVIESTLKHNAPLGRQRHTATFKFSSAER
jgi:hypothetical protein